MAFRRNKFKKRGDILADLGRRGNSMVSNEGAAFGNQLLAGGERLHSKPSAAVYHPAPQYRLQNQDFLTRWSEEACAEVRVFGIPNDPQWFIAGIPLDLFRRPSVWTPRWLVATDPHRRFGSERKA